VTNTLAYWTHSLVKRKIKCWELHPDTHTHNYYADADADANADADADAGIHTC